MKSSLYDVEVEFLYQTEKAILFLNIKGKEVWIPKSQCEIDPKYPERHETVTLTADEGLLEEKEFV